MLDCWSKTPTGALGLLILLDQAPRNMFRNSAGAFATDAHAVEIADAAIARGFHRRVAAEMRRFFALPFEHAENARLQARSLTLFREIGDPEGIRYAEVHAEIIDRFGRFPHRNAALGRRSTKAERRFLAEGGFAG